MKVDPRLEEILEAVAGRGSAEAEVYFKRGRSRRFESTPHTRTTSFHHERGWAVRAGGTRSSFFASGTGWPSPDGPWPEPDGAGLTLPDPIKVPPWSEPAELDAPLLGEREGFELLGAVGRELTAELAGAHLLSGRLEDGSSESEIASSRGVRARVRSRLAALHLEAVGTDRGGTTASLYAAFRDPRRLRPRALAHRLADLLVVRAGDVATGRDRGEVVLAPPVGQHLLAGLSQLFVGREAVERAAALRDRRGKLACDRVAVIDDGRLSGGLLDAPVDGEGIATRETVLVDEGFFRSPLLAWWETRGAGDPRPAGCSRRPSWRDLPRRGPTHLYLRPASGVSVGSLLAGLARGYYLIDVVGSGHFDLAADRFALPVCGMTVQGGRATAPVARAWLSGSISGLLHGVQAVARDLDFAPLDGMIGSPSLLVTGLELRGSP